MLQFIREKTSGLIAIVIVALLIISFAFWGVSYYFDQGGEIAAISVNDAQIDLREYQRVSQNVRRQWQDVVSQNGGNIDDELVKQQTIDSLVERELVNQLNDELELRVTASQVRNVITGVEIFRSERGFDNSLYERAVAQLGFTPAGFEIQIQEDMKSEQLQSAVAETAFVTDDEVRLLAGMKNQTRDFAYTIISSDELKEGIEPTEDEISAFYQANIEDYMEAEQLKIAYLDLSLEQMAAAIEVNEDELQKYYESNKAVYDVDDQRKIRHLTIGLGENAGADEIARATGKAEELIALMKSGMTFDELAEKHSADPDFKIEVSELGFMTRGIMAPEIDELMFSLAEGEISVPVVTAKSVDVIRIDGIKGGVKNTFDNVREQVEQAYRLATAENEYFEASDMLANLTYEHPDTLEIAAEQLGLQIRESGFFNRESTDDPLLSDSRIKVASFSEEVLNGNNSDVLELGNNRVIVLRLLEHKARQKTALDLVRARIVTRMKYEGASAAVREKGETILARLKGGADAEQMAEESNIVWTHATAVKRDNAGINRSVVRTAFSLGRVPDGQSIAGGVSLGSGDYALVILKHVADPDPASFSEEELASIRTQLQQVHASSDWQQLVQNIRELSTINIYSDRL